MRLSDLSELEIEGSKIIFEKILTLIKVRSQLSKNRRRYLTFLSHEGYGYLGEYLEWRLREGEKLGSMSRVIAATTRQTTLNRKAIGAMIKRVFEKAGYPFRPYILRSYFDTAITNARGIPHNIQQFKMGHSGDIEATYTVNKGLPDWQIEEFRQLYSRLIEPKLSTTPQPTQEDLRKRQVLDTVSLLYGNDKEKIRRVEEALAISTEAGNTLQV